MTKRFRLRGFFGTDDPELLAYHATYYRWWTCQVFSGEYTTGVKLGPVTVSWLHRNGCALDVACFGFYGFGIWYL